MATSRSQRGRPEEKVPLAAENGVPEGWVFSLLPEVVEINPPKPPATKVAADAPVTFVPMGAVDERTGTIARPEVRPFSAARKGYTAFTDGDVIMAKITPCMENGKAAIARNLVNGLGFGSTEFHVLRSHGAVLPEYVYHYLRQMSFRHAAEDEMTGSVGQKRVPRGFLELVPLPIPPLAEQVRIVSLLERLLAKVDECRDRLERIPGILSRFRQAVLAAGCSGRLTSSWREADPQVTPVEQTVREIASRRGYTNKPVLTSHGSDELPPTWRVVSSDLLFTFVTSGSRGWAKYYNDKGPIFLRVGNLDHGSISIDLSSVQHVTPPNGAEGVRTLVRAGDLLISITADVGMIGLVPQGMGAAYVNQHVAIARPIEGIDPRYLAWFLAAGDHGQRQLEALQRGATKKGLGLDDVKNVDVHLPPIEEQREIVERIERLLALADSVVIQARSAHRRAEVLREALLARAFRGDLVPTEAELARAEGRSYESAEDLLKRSRTDTRSSDSSSGLRPRRSRRAAAR